MHETADRYESAALVRLASGLSPNKTSQTLLLIQHLVVGVKSFVKHPGFILLTCLVAVGLNQPRAFAQNARACAVVQSGFAYSGFTYRLTSENYPPTGDIQSAIRKAYGDRAEIADWNDLKNIATDGSRLQALLLGTGIPSQTGNAACDNILVNQAGNSTFRGMHFLIARHDGLRPPNWAILDAVMARRCRSGYMLG